MVLTAFAAALTLLLTGASPAAELSGPGAGQDRLEDLQEVLANLASEKPATVAWAAQRAAGHRLPEVAAALQWHLFQPPGDALEQRAVTLCILDALIRLQVDVEGDRLLSLYERHPAPVLILLLTNPEEHREDLYELLAKSEDDAVWRSLANALARVEDPELAGVLLGDLRLALRVDVLDDEPSYFGDVIGAGGGAGGGFGGRYARRFGTGYPPIPRYAITATPRPGNTVLSPGPDVIFHRRTLHRAGPVGLDRPLPIIDRERPIDRHEYRLRLLAQLAPQSPAEIVLVSRWTEEYRFTTGAQYTTAMTGLHAEVAAAYDALLRRLESRGRLPEGGASQHPLPLQMVIRDARGQFHREPLPELPFADRANGPLWPAWPHDR